MRARRTTVEHRFATIKARMGVTHFLMSRLPRVARCHRDGITRAYLQFDTSHQADAGGGHGVKRPDISDKGHLG
jgi:hypothetical protein